MLFNSFEFLVFFALVFVSYYSLSHKLRWLLLLLSSCFFYMYFIPEYILILFFTILITYYSAILIEKSTIKKQRKQILIISILLNISILSYFKYFNFLNNNLSTFLDFFSVENRIPLLEIILPVGLSFFIFQSISYSIEVYRGTLPVERHLGYYSLYVMFFPQLVAGPIERPQNILPQLKKKSKFSFTNLESGLKLILLGLFKKVVVADQLSFFVDNVYASQLNQSPEQIFVAAILFSFQIYCDFSGYSDMAIGLAKTMGIDLMTNFKQPYFSYSLTHFWQRWHISLSSWFKDYLYIPLGGNRESRFKTYRNIFIIFAVSGLWHGSSWTFVIWGLIHGFVVTIERVFKYNPKNKNFFIRSIGVFITFLIVTIAWVFFRSSNIDQAFNFLFSLKNISTEKIIILVSNSEVFYNFILVSLLIIVDFFDTKINLNNLNIVSKTLFYTLVLIFILIMGSFNNNSFIYFQF
jgi:alginate O-acetyltransferase complex protein AlgI